QAADALAKAVSKTSDQLANEATLSGYNSIFAHPLSCSLTGTANDLFASDLHIVRPDGTVACTSLRPEGGLPGIGYGTSHWFSTVVAAKGPVTIGPIVDPITRRNVLIVADPIATGGALIVALHLDGTGNSLLGHLAL